MGLPKGNYIMFTGIRETTSDNYLELEVNLSSHYYLILYYLGTGQNTSKVGQDPIQHALYFSSNEEDSLCIDSF
jgi:hypothetical protein